MITALIDVYAPLIGVAVYLLIIGGLVWLTTRRDQL